MDRTLAASDFGPGKISYFTASSFGTNWKKLKAEVAIKADEFARRCGSPVVVSSAYRSSAQNAAAGGAKTSEHLSGRAVDLSISDPAFFSNLPKYLKLARSIGFSGIGIYEGKKLLHLDIRETPGSWAKLASGRMVALADGLKRLVKKGAGIFGALLLIVSILYLARRTGPGGNNAS